MIKNKLTRVVLKVLMFALMNKVFIPMLGKHRQHICQGHALVCIKSLERINAESYTNKGEYSDPRSSGPKTMPP